MRSPRLTLGYISMKSASGYSESSFFESAFSPHTTICLYPISYSGFTGTLSASPPSQYSLSLYVTDSYRRGSVDDAMTTVFISSLFLPDRSIYSAFLGSS